MRKLDTLEIEKAVYSLALKACVNITPECVNALKTARENEKGKLPKFALDVMIQNAEIAKKENLPVCQDTGLACVMLKIGQEVLLTGDYLIDAVNNGVIKAYKDGYFRKSVLDPITRVNTRNNSPAIVYTEIVKGDKVEIEFLPKGFGSENMSKIYMLSPSDGLDGVINSVVETVKVAGSKPCPPIIVGVGIGGTFDKCAYMAKKALCRKVGVHNRRKDVKELEITLLDKINALGIGAQGLGGKTTALAVNIEVMPTHIAGLPVAVNIQCHANRLGKVVL